MENPDVDALLELVKGRYGGRLTDEQLEELRKSVAAASDRARSDEGGAFWTTGTSPRSCSGRSGGED